MENQRQNWFGAVIAKPFVGSFDFKKNVLTILIPEVHKDGDYVNSKWEIAKRTI